MSQNTEQKYEDIKIMKWKKRYLDNREGIQDM
jgi:hypothetical protein